MAKTTEQLIAEAKVAGSRFRSSGARRAGEIVPLPGLRRPTEEERAADLRRDDDGSEVVE